MIGQEIEKRLYDPFDEDDVEWIEGDDGKNFANSNPRVYEDRLDNVLGANNWSCDHDAIERLKLTLLRRPSTS